MVPRRKRTSYVTESDTSSGEDVDYFSFQEARRLNVNIQNDNMAHTSNKKQSFQKTPTFRNSSKVKHEYDEEMADSDKKSRCTSKNALMARENRKRKKLYVQNLENEVTKLKGSKRQLNTILHNQSLIISELQNEIKYLKSVLANSSDISNLIKNIRNSTGMSVTTSLDKTLSLNNSCVSKPKPYVARKTAYPWEHSNESICDIPLVDESLSSISPTSDCTNDFDISNVFEDLDFPLDSIGLSDFNIDNNENQYMLPEVLESNECQINTPQFMEHTWNDHSYSNTVRNETDDVGVCLHVSKHRVSLEFCTSCNENATGAWKGVD